MFTNIFDNKNKLECSKTNPKFIFLLATIRQVLLDSLSPHIKTLNHGAKDLFSSNFEKYFPLEPSNLDQLKKENVFYGEYSIQFSDIYFELIDLWTTIQDERVAELSGSKINIDLGSFKKIVSDKLGKLNDIVEDLKLLK